MPLTDRATNILDLLDSYEIGDRPIIFITHSLGGLLVKQMLRKGRDLGKWSAIASHTKGIVFLSTPHSGSDMASWINYIGGILQTSVSVEELKAHHSHLRDLNLFYRNDEQFSQIPMLIYCETRPTGPVLVVNQTSADPGIKGIIPIPMDFDHISICKVADKKSQIYRQVKRFIEKNLTTALLPIPLKPTGREVSIQGMNADKLSKPQT
jgi:pimeloyl-ACP methyl ester carboxylesterase